MRSNRKRLLFGLAWTLVASLSCTSGDLPLATETEGEPRVTTEPPAPAESAPVPPPESAPAAPVDTVTAPVDTIPATPVDTIPAEGPDSVGASLLSCQPQPYAVSTAVIGPKGGWIVVGNHSLKIPENALSEDVTITAEQVEGSVNSVRFSPEGLHFAVPAIISLSYKNCDNVRHWKRIVYTDEMLKILEGTLSLDFSNSSQVKGLIYHFSRYAVAY